MGEKANAARPDLCVALADRHAEVRQAAAEAIEKIDPKLYQFVMPMLVDADSYKRVERIRSVSSSKEFAKIVYPVILAKARSMMRGTPSPANASGYIDDEFHAYVDTVLSIGKADEDGNDLILQIAGDRRYGELSLRCLRSFPNLSASDPKRRVDLLVSAVKARGIPGKRNAIPALGEMGRHAKGTIDMLRKEKGNSDSYIREHANLAIKAIEDDLAKAEREKLEKLKADEEKKKEADSKGEAGEGEQEKTD